MGEPDVLSIWTVYKKPRDYPHCYAARRFEIGPAGPVATNDRIVSTDLDVIRGYLEMRGLTVLPREQGDEGHIIESWI